MPPHRPLQLITSVSIATSLAIAGCRSPSRAPEGALTRNLGVVLSEDAATNATLERSLREFLREASRGRFPADLVDPTDRERTSFFFNGLTGLGATGDIEHPLEPVLLKSYSMDGRSYAVTVAFNDLHALPASLVKIVELMATPHAGGYRFASPFDKRTARLNQTVTGNVTFHHAMELDRAAAEEFVAFRARFARDTGTPNPPLDYYCFESLDHLLTSYGFVFDSSKCNFLGRDLGFSDNGGRTFVTGTGNPAYIYEYIGEHLRAHLPNSAEIYWPFANGMSAYYGGYGLSGEPIDVLKSQFRDALRERPEIDFLEEFEKGRGSAVQRHFSYYVMSAFLCQEAVESHGFDAAMRLVTTGPDGERFFETLERTLGVDRSNFHATIVRLIADRSV